MTTPCGLTKEELRKFKWVDESQRCTALFEDRDGHEQVCKKLYTSHPSADHPSADQGKEGQRQGELWSVPWCCGVLSRIRSPVLYVSIFASN